MLKAVGDFAWVRLTEDDSAFRKTAGETISVTTTLGEKNILCEKMVDIQTGEIKWKPVKIVYPSEGSVLL